MRKKFTFIAVGILCVLVCSAVLWTKANSAEPPSSPAGAMWLPFAQPMYNWRVCEDLGIGVVPGIPDRRQRFRLCHNRGWEFLAYCLQPNLPAPEIGTICSRINENTFYCGAGIQNLRLYAVLQTPTPTPSPTPTNTPTPVIPTGTPRPRAGGMGNLVFRRLINVKPTASPTKTPFQPLSITRTPFQPLHPTPEQLPENTPAPEQLPSSFYGIDFSDQSKRIHIKIFPSDKRVNHGKPIGISFIPGQQCNYADHRACTSTYQSATKSEVTYITVHSGVGGEGQAFRHAVEGTGINSAAYHLKQVHINLRALDGAEVVIVQGKKRVEGFTLVAAARIPPVSMEAYFEAPIEDALALAASVDPSLSKWINPGQPQIVFETCGWKIPGERWAPGVTGTTASVYLGIIQKKP